MTCVDKLIEANPEAEADRALLESLEAEVDLELKSIALRNESPNAGMKKFLDNYKEYKEQRKLDARRDAAFSSLAEIRMIQQVETFGKGKEQAQGILSNILGDQFGSENSAWALKNQTQTRWQNDIIYGLESLSETHLKVFTSNTDSHLTARAMYLDRVNNKTPAQIKSYDDVPKIHKEIATVLNKTDDTMMAELNTAGGRIGRYDGRAYKSSHNPKKIEADGFDAWWNNTRKKIDYVRAFGKIEDQLDGDLVQKQAKMWYDSILSGEYQDAASANIATKVSHHRNIHFKDGDTFHAYQEEYGVGNLKDAIMIQVSVNAKQYGMMSKLGPKAEQSVKNVIKRTLKKAKQDGDQEAIDAINSASFAKKLSDDTGLLSGSIDVPANDALKLGTDGLKMLQTFSKLGSTLASSVTDVPNMMMSAKVNGRTMLSGVRDAIDGVLNTMSSKADKESVARAVNISLDTTRASFAEMIGGNQAAVGGKAKAYAAFFKLNLVSAWTNAMKRGHVAGTASFMGEMAEKSFNQLDDTLQRSLKVAGITEDVWSVVSKSIDDIGGKKVFVSTKMDNVSDDAISGLITKEGGLVTARSIAAKRKELSETVSTWYNYVLEGAVIEPSGKTQSMLRQGLQTGTPYGSMMELMTQFKSFPVSQIRQRVMRDVELKTGERFGADSFKKGSAGAWMPDFAQYFVAMGMFGYAAVSMRDIASGKSLRDPTDPETMAASLAQGGAVPILSDFLFGDMKSRYGAGPLMSFLGPTMSMLDSTIDTLGRAKSGEDPTGAAIRLIHNNMPLQNLIYTRGLMNYFIMDRVYNELSPGRAARQSKAIEEEGRSFLWHQEQGL